MTITILILAYFMLGLATYLLCLYMTVKNETFRWSSFSLDTHENGIMCILLWWLWLLGLFLLYFDEWWDGVHERIYEKFINKYDKK